jgi:sporulation protein YlmC with PRC-barrel domain
MKRIYLVGPLLILALLASACGDGPTAPSAGGATPTAVVDLAEDTPDIADTDGITETDPGAAAEETAIPGEEQTSSMTDTVGITDTQSITDGAGMDDSEAMTDTNTLTDTPSVTDGTTITDSETMTGTETITGTDAMTGTPTPAATSDMTDTVDAAAVGDTPSRGVIRSSELLGYNIENAEGEDLGSVNDAIISLEQGCINYLVLSFGGILGLGESQYLIPWHAVTIDPAEERLLLNIDPSALDAAPTFDVDNLPDMTSAEWDSELTGYWNAIDVVAPDTAPDSSTADQHICDEVMPVDIGGGIGTSDAITETADAAATPEPSEEELTVQTPLVIRLSDLLDYTVNNPEGEELGGIEDIMIDWREDRMVYAILSFGGFMGLGEKWFVMPLSSVTVDPVEQRLIFDADPEVLQDAPGFDADDLPDTADPDWDLGIRDYWDSLQ